jgi:tRNA(Ile)-lysidine synthase
VLTSPAGPDLARLFQTFDIFARRSVIAAISGGSDSTALLLLLKEFRERQGSYRRLIAVTIDHMLRDGSTAEAEAVGALCAGLGIPHRILAWSGPKPTTGIAAAAREARYRLLALAAREEESDLVLTGHTADDQAETVLMRQARDSGRGLAGIAPATLFGGSVWIGRPLLGARRADLRAYLRGRGVGWADDPTNIDQKYERPRVRVALGAGGDRVEAALAVASEAAAEREALGIAAAALIETHARRVAPGLVRLDPAFLDTETPAAVYALRILLAVVGGREHLPDEARVTGLLERLRREECFRGVLSRTLVDKRKAGIFLLREARGSRTHAPTNAGVVSSDVPPSLARAARATCPETSILAPWHRFLPSFDLAPARAAARVFGVAEIPDPPFPGHNGRKA